MAKDWQSTGTRLHISLLSTGALAGLIATIPMTLFMLLMHRLLPQWQKYALPPERITHELSERIGADKYLNKPRLLWATLASHFGYGASMGTLYGTLSKRIPLPAVVKGIIFGVLIWAGSYLGWLPAMDMKAAATKEPPQRDALMVAAHVVWSATTGIIDDVLNDN